MVVLEYTLKAKFYHTKLFIEELLKILLIFSMDFTMDGNRGLNEPNTFGFQQEKFC